jgi:sugar transferase (PEP-CTERM/EpsH1 system associated)
MAPYILSTPRAEVRVVDLVDVDSEKWRAYSDKAGWLMRAIYQREWRRVAALEERIVQECDHSLFVSDAEAAVMRGRVPEYESKIVGLSNGVDHAFFNPAMPYRTPFVGDAPTFVFTGTMDYPPNVDAVRWFARDILPLIRERIPTARFYIVGNHPVSAVRQLENIDGVVVTGWVADVRPYLAHATAAVAPMRIARGIQNKVLEAMAMGCPVVLTSGALEGIDAEPGLHVLLANDPQTFALACLTATGPGGLQLGAAARQRAVACYDWAVRLDPLVELLSRSIKRPSELSCGANSTMLERSDVVRVGPGQLEHGDDCVSSRH